MKVLLLIFLAIGGVFAGVVRNPNIRFAENNVIAFFDCLKEIGYVGNEEAGVPVLDPLSKGDLALTIGTGDVSGTVHLVYEYIIGMLGFEYAAVSGTIGLLPPRYDFDITLHFPSFRAFINTYDVNMVFEKTNTHFYGLGTIAFDATDLYLRMNLSIHILIGITFENISIIPSLYGMSLFVATGLYNDERYSQQVSSNFLNDPYNAMANISEPINTLLSSMLSEYLNSEDFKTGSAEDSPIWRCAFPY